MQPISKAVLVYLSVLLALTFAQTAFAQTTAFSYQGNLNFSGQPANGNFDFEFGLFDAADGGNQLGTTQAINGVAVATGSFAVVLDFGTQFTGPNRFLEIRVRQTGQPGTTTLSPRQLIRTVPYALKSLAADTAQTAVTATNAANVVNATSAVTAETATNALSLGGVAPGQYVLTGDVRLTNERTPTAGSPNYIQNQSSAPQADANFNIGGNGIVGGNIGVGTIPTEKLDVAGNIKFSGNIIGDGSGLVGTTAATTTNQALLGSLRWDLLGSKTFPAGSNSRLLAFDGENIWVANLLSSNVTKLRATDGANLGAFPAGLRPSGIAFDGTNMWVTDNLGNSVKKIRAIDGADQGTFPVGTGPGAIAFDGANIWVANGTSNNVTKLRASDGANQGTFPVGASPRGVAFDGANIWVTNFNDNNVRKLRASDGADLGTFATGTNPWGVAFDGLNIWIVNFGSNNVTKLRASDGALQGTYAVGTAPRFLAFDGENVWVANGTTNDVTKLQAADGANLGTFPVGNNPWGIAFDGSNIWTANNGANNVTKLPAFP